MASERAVQAAKNALHPDAPTHPEAIARQLDAAFPIMLRSAIEGMTEEQFNMMSDEFCTPENIAEQRAALLRAVGVAVL